MTTPPIIYAVNSVLQAAFLILASFLSIWLAFIGFNRMPARWLADYGEKPPPELYETRLFYRPTGIMFSLLLGLSLIIFQLQYGFALRFWLAAVISLLAILIGLADFKYSIIPDQFTVIMAVLCAWAALDDLSSGGGTGVYLTYWWEPFAGAAAGFLVMMLVNGLGALLYRKQGVGFGDVKLFAAIGLLLGWRQTLLVFFLTILLAFLHFSTLLLRKVVHKNVYLPLGPYICGALVLWLAFYPQINHVVDVYIRLITRAL